MGEGYEIRRIPDDPDEALAALCEEQARFMAAYLKQPTMPTAYMASKANRDWWAQVRAAVVAKVDARAMELMRDA